MQQAARNYLLFDAPVGIFVTIERYLAKGSWFDVALCTNHHAGSACRGIAYLPAGKLDRDPGVPRHLASRTTRCWWSVLPWVRRRDSDRIHLSVRESSRALPVSTAFKRDRHDFKCLTCRVYAPGHITARAIRRCHEKDALMLKPLKFWILLLAMGLGWGWHFRWQRWRPRGRHAIWHGLLADGRRLRDVFRHLSDTAQADPDDPSGN